jgi:eukaryotic-like serine/threonine-protein kinase
MPLSAGTRLGPFEIVSALGAGGMGEVYRARDTRLGRDVAIKVLPEAFAADPDRLRRFEQEARAIAALNHPHICQLHDVGEGYLVLEYVEGDPVRGPMAVTDALRVARQIAGALDAAHQRGILHRDLKPANIILSHGSASTEPTAKLLDFGIAKLMDAPGGVVDDATRTVAGAVIGTAAYMSPEQAEGKPLDARSDIFSFGAVLYELLSGRRAFDGDSTAHVVSAVLRDDPPALNAPQAVEQIVRRCIAKRPADRFQTMRELRAALDEMSASPAEEQPSIVVLPFENMSGDKENEYFSDGLAEEIINALTRIPGLKVIARTSAFAFKGKHEDVRRIAEALGVTKVLEGSVRKAGNRIRVMAQLIAAADGSHVWSERYDRELADVFAVQDEIAAAITAALRGTFSASAPLQRHHTPNLLAYDHYLKAIHLCDSTTPQTMARAQDHFERAIALDPLFALAHAEFAHLYHLLGVYGVMAPLDAIPLMRIHTLRALEIDPSLPEGHAMLATVSMFHFDWTEAERHFQFAMGHGAVPSRVHRYYAHYCLLPTGRASEAVRHYRFGLSEDPLNLQFRCELAVCLRAAGRLAESDDELRRILQIDATFWFPYFILGVNRVLDGYIDEAVALSERAFQLAPWFRPIVGFRAAMLRRTGQVEAADQISAEHLRPSDRYADPVGSAMFHLVSGELDAAADWTATAIEQRQIAVLFFVHAHATALRSTPRWPALARMMNLTDATA